MRIKKIQKSDDENNNRIKIVTVDYQPDDFSYKFNFEKITPNLVFRESTNNWRPKKLLDFKTKIKNQAIDVNVYSKFTTEHFGNKIELKFTILDQSGDTEEVILAVYDKDPSSYSIYINRW